MRRKLDSFRNSSVVSLGPSFVSIARMIRDFDQNMSTRKATHLMTALPDYDRPQFDQQTLCILALLPANVIKIQEVKSGMRKLLSI